MNTVVKALYVDDFASGKDSVKDCFELYGKLKLRFREGSFNMRKKETLDNLSSAFSEVLSALQQCLAIASLSPTSVAKNVCARLKSDEPGKPAFDIPAELLEDLLVLGFTYTRIAEMLGVSRWTISRRIKDYGLKDSSNSSSGSLLNDLKSSLVSSAS